MALARLLVGLDVDADLRAHDLHGLGKAYAFDLLYELEDVAACVAPEAFVNLHFLMDGERSGALRMEGAAGKMV